MTGQREEYKREETGTQWSVDSRVGGEHCRITPLFVWPLEEVRSLYWLGCFAPLNFTLIPNIGFWIFVIHVTDICLPLPPKCWGLKHVPLWPACPLLVTTGLYVTFLYMLMWIFSLYCVFSTLYFKYFFTLPLFIQSQGQDSTNTYFMSISEFYKHLLNAYSVANELYSNEKGVPSLCLHEFHKGMKE